MRFFRISVQRWCGEFVCGRVTPEFYAYFKARDAADLEAYMLGNEEARDPAAPPAREGGDRLDAWFDFDDVAHISSALLQNNYVHVAEVTADAAGDFHEIEGGYAESIEIEPLARESGDNPVRLARRLTLDEDADSPANPAIMVRALEKGAVAEAVVQDADGFDISKLSFIVIDFHGDLVIDEMHYAGELLEQTGDSSSGKGTFITLGDLTDEIFDPPASLDRKRYFQSQDRMETSVEDAPGSVFAREELELPEGAPALPEKGYTDVDRWAWARILESGSADFHARFDTEDESARSRALRTGVVARGTPAHLPIQDANGNPIESSDLSEKTEETLTPEMIDAAWHHRTLSSDFLNLILCSEPWRSAIDTQVIDITGARLLAYLDRTCTHGIILDACLIPDDALFASNTFEGRFFMRDCTVIGRLSFMHCQFSQSPKFERVWAATVDFSDAKIAGSPQIANCVFEMGADFMDMKAASSLVLNGTAIHGVIDADRIELGGSLLARQMPRVTQFDLVSATIGGALDLSETRIDCLVDLTNARIQRELRLSTKDRGPTIWGPEARFVLRNAETHALQASKEALMLEPAPGKRQRKKRRFVPTDLSGFRFQTFGGLDSDGTDTLADAPVAMLRGWIESRPNFNHRYTPTPYHAFASVLRQSGYADKASALMIAKSDHRLKVRNTPLLMKASVLFSGLVSGYGQRNHRALFWFVVLALLGAAAGMFAEGWSPLQREALPPSWDDWLRASLDNAAPIVEFSPESAGAPERLLGTAMPGWLSGLWFGISIFGFVVLSYLLAGISGLFDRGES